MRLIAKVAIGLLMLSSLPLAGGIAQENDYLIVPGQRVDRWELGKPVDAYGFGRQAGRWEGTAGGRPYYDGFSFPQPPRGPYLSVYTCKSDNLVMAILVERRLDASPQADPEEVKYKTAEGVRIGMEESEVLRLLGSPDGTWQSTGRHGQLEILVRGLDYWNRGFFARVNRTDLKVFAIGAARLGGFWACQQAVLGTSPAAQPASGPSPASVGIPVNVPLPVPMPGDLRIAPPGPDVPANRAAFSGVWVGRWDNVLDTALAVREITSSGVSAVYSWGVASTWRIDRAGWTNARGRFAGPDELHVQTATLVIYRMRSDGRLDAEFGQGGPRTIMTRVFPR